MDKSIEIFSGMLSPVHPNEATIALPLHDPTFTADTSQLQHWTPRLAVRPMTAKSKSSPHRPVSNALQNNMTDFNGVGTMSMTRSTEAAPSGISNQTEQINRPRFFSTNHLDAREKNKKQNDPDDELIFDFGF